MWKAMRQLQLEVIQECIHIIINEKKYVDMYVLHTIELIEAEKKQSGKEIIKI